MQVIPALDLKDGKCVRLTQGRLEKESIFSLNPVSVALKWEEKGAKILHIIDLNGAFKGSPQNLDIVKKIVKSLKIPIQLGGGIRDFTTIKKILDIGVEKVILGTSVINAQELVKKAIDEFKGRIGVGIDVYEGKVFIKGWQEETSQNAISLAKEIEKLGVKWVVFTDIKKDGTMEGPNIKEIRKIARAVNIPVVASGGISSLEDIKKIKSLEKYGVSAIIIGKALYTGALDLEEAISLIEK